MSDPLIDDVLHRRFGFDAFRPGQRPLVEAILSGTGVLGVMPTGAGKSLCFQLPALVRRRLVVVVSPLISLMQDQVDHLTALGIEAAAINSASPPARRRQHLQNAIAGRLALLYVTPERFTPAFTSRLRAANPWMLVVDEAHCISQWGHDFRPPYLRLGEAAKALGVEVVSAFTATATPDVREDIVTRLELPAAGVHVFGFHRPNLRFDVVPIARMPQKVTLIERHVRTHPEHAGIVYAATRKSVERVAAALQHSGFDAGFYHAGLSDRERQRAQEHFMAGERRVMVATNAFGMGIDRADIRFVIHHELPGSLEAYYQEAGRAGRDGDPALCTLLFSYADTHIQRFLMEQRDVGLRARDEAKLEAVIHYGYGRLCRHSDLLGYFGETLLPPCGACDVCLGGALLGGPRGRYRATTTKRQKRTRRDTLPPRPVEPDELTVVQKVLSAVVRAQGTATATTVAHALTGATTPQVVHSTLVGTKSHGILAGWPRRLLVELIEALFEAGCLIRIGGLRSRYELTPFGTEVMWRRREVSLRIERFSAPERAEVLPELSEADRDLLDALRLERDDVARVLGVPGYQVCTDRALIRMAAERPRTRQEMLRIKGIGPTSEARIGARCREVIRTRRRGK